MSNVPINTRLSVFGDIFFIIRIKYNRMYIFLPNKLLSTLQMTFYSVGATFGLSLDLPLFYIL